MVLFEFDILKATAIRGKKGNHKGRYLGIVLSRPLTHIYARISYFSCSAYICYINKNNFVKKTLGTYLSMYFITSESMKIINFVFFGFVK
jgi:hypothetical protein